MLNKKQTLQKQKKECKIIKSAVNVQVKNKNKINVSYFCFPF